MKPIHKHDCECCQFLGSFKGEDLYYHEENRITLIARFGEDGDYTSGLTFAKSEKDNPESPIGEAYRRAEALGLKLKQDWEE